MHRLKLLILQLHFLQLVRKITVLSTSSNFYRILSWYGDYVNNRLRDEMWKSIQSLQGIICLTLILMTEFPSRDITPPSPLIATLSGGVKAAESKAEVKHHHSELQLIYPAQKCQHYKTAAMLRSVGIGQCPGGATKAPLFILFIAIVCLLHNSMASPFLSLMRRFLRRTLNSILTMLLTIW